MLRSPLTACIFKCLLSGSFKEGEHQGGGEIKRILWSLLEGKAQCVLYKSSVPEAVPSSPLNKNNAFLPEVDHLLKRGV